MTTELEVVVDTAMGGEEALGVARRLEPLHLAFSSSCRLMRNLGPVVEVATLSVSTPGMISRLAAAYLHSLSVTITG